MTREAPAPLYRVVRVRPCRRDWIFMINYIYITIIGLSFIASLASFRLAFPYHLKLFSVLLGCTFLVEVTAVRMYKTHHSNVPLYNIFMLVEFCTYAYYYKCIAQPRWLKKMVDYFLVGFPLFWGVVVFFVFGIGKWNSYVVIAGSLFTIFFSAAYYYQLFTQDVLVRLESSPEFWIATGLIIFYTFNLPFMGMLNFLVKNYLELSSSFMESATSRIAGYAFTMACTVLGPSITGMFTSMRRISGFSGAEASFLSRSSPWRASRLTSNPLNPLMRIPRDFRKSWWSSAIPICIFIYCLIEGEF